jgi:hypothetical protein
MDYKEGSLGYIYTCADGSGLTAMRGTEPCGGGVMADRPGSDDGPKGAATATSARGGATANVEDDGQRKTVGASAGFRLPLPQGFDVDPKRVLWLGGLAALAAVEIIEWPVALVVGAGGFVAEWMARQDAARIAAQRS